MDAKMQRYKTSSIIFIFIALLSFISINAAIDEAPPWLKQAASITIPPQEKKIGAVILHNRIKKIFSEDGKTTTITNGAIRILTSEGKENAHASVTYNTDSEKVKEIKAWIIRPSGEVKSLGKDHIIEGSPVDNNVYDDVRNKGIFGAGYADPGSVFGYEIVTEDRSIFSQVVHGFQNDIPVLESSITVELPPNWKANGITFNHAEIAPKVTGNTYIWEMRNLAPFEDEPSSPGMHGISPRIAISIFPPSDKAGLLKSFPSWRDVSRFYSELSDPQAAFDPTISAKTTELTSNRKTELEKIKAIGRYAQNINYISIQIGLGKGGGYRPHAATDIFRKNYGDCKDKANLMRAMLKSIGIDSYPVSIFSGDPTHVREEWPSPHQFNHEIIGVTISDETKAQSVITHPALGRLLIFDPTDEYTPLGDLPGYLQGSLALVVAGDKGTLERMPVTDPESNMLQRNIEAEISPEGSLTAKIQQHSTGQPAATERRFLKNVSNSDYIKLMEKWISRNATGTTVNKIDPKDDMNNGKFSLEIEFKSPQYAQLMRGKLLVFKPAIVSRRTSISFTDASRKYPVIIEGDAYSETTKIKLPDGFTPDEIPETTEINQPFGYYATSSIVKDGYLTFKRSLVLRGGIIPADQYQSVRKFFAQIRTAENAPVVLVKN